MTMTFFSTDGATFKGASAFLQHIHILFRNFLGRAKSWIYPENRNFQTFDHNILTLQKLKKHDICAFEAISFDQSRPRKFSKHDMDMLQTCSGFSKRSCIHRRKNLGHRRRRLKYIASTAQKIVFFKAFGGSKSLAQAEKMCFFG